MSRTALITVLLAIAGLTALAGTAAAAGPVGPGTIVAPTTPPPPVPPPPPAPTPVYLADPLTRVYRGDDGGALYLRQLGTKVFGFGEHPGLKYAYVLSGSITGDRITGSWWDVPKGTRGTRGTLDLRWTQVGARLVHAGGDVLGPKVFTSISADGIPWPVMQAAGFQTMSANDLDGAFVGDDGSRHYVRELSGTTVWVAERAAQPDERPGWVSVFVGQRKPGGVFGGTYVDVPKGIERESGVFGAALLGSKRELALEQTGTDRTKRLGPDYALDWDRFTGEIAKSLNGNVVGYAYAMTKNGGIIRSGAWGSRRLGVDGGALPFTTHTKAQTASAAKLVGAVAIVKALHDRGLGVDTRVKPFLPSCLKTAKSISTLTFRDILDHTSGLPGARGSGTVESCNGEDPYECLLKILKVGRTQTLSPAYNNKAYDLLRLLVPLVAHHQDTEAMYDFWKCKNTKGVLHRKLSERFVRYLLDDVLGPADATASFYPGGDFSLNYKCKRRTILRRTDPCDPPTSKGAAPRVDFFERSGSGKMTISVLDYIRFLSALDRGLIVPKGLVETMKTDRLGFDSSSPYAWKNGGCPDFEGQDRTCKTVAMIFPGDIQAYVAVNSDLSRLGGSIQTIVARAFNAALR